MVWAPAKTLNPMWPSAPPRGSTQANKTNKLTGELLLGFFSGCCLLLLLFLFSSSSSASFLSVFPLFLFCLSVFLIGPSIAVVAVVVVSFPHHFFPPVTLLCDSAFFDLISLIFLLFLNSVLLFSFLCFFFLLFLFPPGASDCGLQCFLILPPPLSLFLSSSSISTLCFAPPLLLFSFYDLGYFALVVFSISFSILFFYFLIRTFGALISPRHSLRLRVH